jgi:uncharacterized protein (TIGR03435 family)
MMTRGAGIVSVIVLISSRLFGQPAPPIRAFEVASVKPHEGPMYRLGVSTSGSRLNADSSNVLMLVKYAYDLKNYQVSGIPPLLKEDNTRWDVVAKAEGDTVPTKAEFRQMLQSLLADRLNLIAHRETREMLVYALMTGKNGSKLKASAADANEAGRIGPRNGGRNYYVTLTKATVSGLIEILDGSGFLDRPVVDRSGITGTFDIELTYTPETRANLAAPDPDDIRIFSALQDQLGLRLEPQKAMIEMMVVDHVEKPSGN